MELLVLVPKLAMGQRDRLLERKIWIMLTRAKVRLRRSVLVSKRRAVLVVYLSNV